MADEELLTYYYYKWEKEKLGTPHIYPRLRSRGSYTYENSKLEEWFSEQFFEILQERWAVGPLEVSTHPIKNDFSKFVMALNTLSICINRDYPGIADNDLTSLLLKKTIRQLDISSNPMDEAKSAFTPGSALYFLELYANLRDQSLLSAVQSKILSMSKVEANRLIRGPCVMPKEWPHQLEAFTAWEDNNHMGIIEMATGTGKTLVGLMAIRKLYNEKRRGTVLVLGPSKAILNQWRRETIDKLGLIATRDRPYTDPVRIDNFSIHYNTFQSVYKAPDNYYADLLIVDEVHHGAAKEFRNVLGVDALWKMGLSATVEGGMRESILGQELGRIVYTFTLQEAISRNIIPSFEWKIHPTYLSIEEREEFAALSHKIRSCFRDVKGDRATIKRIVGDVPFEIEDLHDFVRLFEIARYKGVELPDDWKNLQVMVMNRRWIIHRSRPKVEKAIELAKNYGATNKVILFAMDTDTCDLIASELEHSCKVYVAHSKRKEDASSQIEMFKRTSTGILIGARMLDEGIDIPDADIGINVSSSKTRLQLVQRMGRILRKRPGKNPVFHHYIALPDSNEQVEEEDDLRFIDDLAWVQETALHLGLGCRLVEEESELQRVRERAEQSLSRRIERRPAYPPTFGTLNLNSIIAEFSDEARNNMLRALGNYPPSHSITDEEWMQMIRNSYQNERDRSSSNVTLPGSWYLLVIGDRNPIKLGRMLRSVTV